MMLKAEKRARKPKASLKNFVAEELSTFHKLTLDTNINTDTAMKAKREETLCVDILNQFRVNNEDKEDPNAAIRRVRKEIECFVKCCRRDGYKIIGFIDKGISSRETDEKWESRRIEELTSGRRNCLVNVQNILGSNFHSLGVPIHYSIIDCDDTIAAFAYHTWVYILTNADFLKEF